MRKLIVFLILLILVLGILDRVTVSGVQSEIAKQVAARYDLQREPTVMIEGIPFLTQAVAGRYEEIKVSMGEMTREGITLDDVDATLYGVTAPLTELLQDPAQAEIMAERVVGEIVIPREVIEQRAPRGLKLEGEGDKLRVSGEITVRGLKVPVQAEMKLETVEGGVRLVAEKVTLAGGIPVPQEAARSLTYTIPIENLPLDLKVTGVKSVPAGLQVTGEAENVPLRG